MIVLRKYLPTKRLQFLLLVTAILLVVAPAVFGQPAPEFGAEPFDAGEASPLMTFLGELHPLAVHFPLALGFAALFFESLYLISKNTVWHNTGFHTLTLGTAISLITIFTGLTASTIGPFLGEDALLLDTHRLFGLTSCGLLLLTTYIGSRARLKQDDRLRWVYRAGLFVMTVCVFIAGHFGAKLSGLSPF